MRLLVVGGLEVVEHPSPDEYVIVSGFGERAQWYRNVLANPNVKVSCGPRRNVPAVATPMPPAGSIAALHRYARAHPRAWASLHHEIYLSDVQETDPAKIRTLLRHPVRTA
ncbi:MAG: hypothetical protein JWQ95_6962 [Sphaerisporangium sp.]|nr:hypothetical protein [Sphaerisporangium sp.]